MVTTNDLNTLITTRKRVVFVILGLLLVFFAVGPPLFGALKVFTAWNDGLDGGQHRFHELAHGVSSFLMLIAGVVMIVRPAQALGVAQQLIARGVGFLIAFALGLHFWPPVVIYPVIAIIVVAAVLISFRGHLPWHLPKEQRPAPSHNLLILSALLAVPLIWYGLDQAALQRSSEILHSDLAHWAGGTAMSVMIILLALFGARKMPGWRVPAWSAGFALFMLGLGSVVMPNQASSYGVLWGIVAIVGALAYVALAEYESRAAALPAVAQPART
jgi:hypothetical protein